MSAAPTAADLAAGRTYLKAALLAIEGGDRFLADRLAEQARSRLLTEAERDDDRYLAWLKYRNDTAPSGGAADADPFAGIL